MAEYLGCLESLHELSVVAKLPTLINIFDRLLDSESPVLTRRCWRAINNRSRLTASELGEFIIANKLLEKWLVDSVHNPRINFMSALKAKGGGVEYKRASKVMANFLEIYPTLFKTIKPAVAELETFLECRAPMTEMGKHDAQQVLPCTDPEMYRSIFAELYDYDEGGGVPQNSDGEVNGANLSGGDLGKEARDRDAVDIAASTTAAAPTSVGGGVGLGGRRRVMMMRPLNTAALGKVKRSYSDSDSDESEADEFRYDDGSASKRRDDSAFSPGDARQRRLSKTSGADSEEDADLDQVQEVDDLGDLDDLKGGTGGASSERLHSGIISAQAMMGGNTPGLLGLSAVRAPNGDQEMGAAAFANNSPNLVKDYLIKRTESLAGCADVIDHYLLCLLTLSTTLSFMELLEKPRKYAGQLTEVAKLSSHFVRVCLPLMERVLVFEPKLLRLNIFNKTTKGLHSGKKSAQGTDCDGVMRQIVYKIRLLDAMFSALDIFLFPRAIEVHSGGVKSICISHVDPAIVLTGGYDRLIRIWDTRNGACLALFAGHKSIVTWCKFSSKDTLIVSGSFDATVKVWDSKTAQCIATFTGHTDSVIDGDLSPDDSLILSCSMDSTVRLWGLQSGQCFRVYNGHAPNTWVKAVSFTPDGLGFVSAGLDKRLVFWDLHDETGNPVQTWEAHSDYILDMVVLDAKTPLLLTTSKDRTQKIFDLTNHGIRKTINSSLPSWSCTVCFSPDGRLFACGSFDNYVLVYMTSSGQLLRQLRVHNDGILKLAFTHDGACILCGTSNGKLQVLDL